MILPNIAFASWWNPFTWFKSKKVESAPAVVEPQATNPSAQKKITVPAPDTSVSKKKETPKAKATPVIKTEPTPQIAPSPTPSAPPNTTLCNGTYWNACQSGQDFVCPASGNAYCQIPQQTYPQANPYQQQTENQAIQQVQAETALIQDKINQTNALVAEYNQKLAALEQQIIEIKNKYYQDYQNAARPGSFVSRVEAERQQLLNQANLKIGQIQNEEQQLYLDYQVKINALR